MAKMLKRRSEKVGLSPGSFVHVGRIKREKVDIQAIIYDEAAIEEFDNLTVSQCKPLIGKRQVAWFNINGIHDVELMQELSECFDIHPLMMEDILNTEQRPKVEELPDKLVLIIKMLYEDPGNESYISEQVSIVFGKDFVITFQEDSSDVFNPVRERLRKSVGKTRRMGADYLSYALVDVIVDHYFVVLEDLGEDVESLEEMFDQPSEDLIRCIYEVKQQLAFVRKHIWPTRDVVSYLYRSESPLISDELRPFLRDVYDHIIQIADTVEIYRDVSSGLADLSVSLMSNRMNKVMQFLTVIATIFIPLTFIAGVYGMNFQYMPELTWRYGYFTVLGFMALVGIGMMAFFRKKGWV